MRVSWCGRKRYARRVVFQYCYGHESENHIDPARDFLNSFLRQVNWMESFLEIKHVTGSLHVSAYQ